LIKQNTGAFIKQEDGLGKIKTYSFGSAPSTQLPTAKAHEQQVALEVTQLKSQCWSRKSGLSNDQHSTATGRSVEVGDGLRGPKGYETAQLCTLERIARSSQLQPNQPEVTHASI